MLTITMKILTNTSQAVRYKKDPQEILTSISKADSLPATRITHGPAGLPQPLQIPKEDIMPAAFDSMGSRDISRVDAGFYIYIYIYIIYIWLRRHPPPPPLPHCGLEVVVVEMKNDIGIIKEL